MKSKTLLLKNAFRSSWKAKSQLIGISLLVMLMTIILSLVSSSYEQIHQKNIYLNEKSNLRDGIFDVQNSKRAQKAEDKNVPNNQTYLFQYYFDQVAKDNELKWSRTEARTFSQLKENNKNINMKIVSKTSPTEKVEVDSLVISKGNNFSTNRPSNDIAAQREMVINENFARLNGIKIGDIVRVEEDAYGSSVLIRNSNNLDDSIRNQLNTLSTEQIIENNKQIAWFHIIGFGTSADFATPMTDITTVFPDSSTSFIGYVKPENFGLMKTGKQGFVTFDQTKSLLYGTEFGKESYFSFKYGSNKIDIRDLEKQFNDKALEEGLVNKKIGYLNNDTSYTYSTRILLFTTVINAYNIIAIFLFVITILIALFALSIVLKKRVEAVQTQMGCLRALGYRKKEILLNFLAIPTITAALGVSVGYLISIGISTIVINTFSSFFTISFGAYTFSILGWFTTFLVGFILLTIVATIFILIEIKKPPLMLLHGKNASKYSYVGMFIKSLFVNAKFDTRLRMSIFAGSWVKFVGTFVTILASTILITFTSIAPNIIAKNETASFDGMDYEFVTEYQQPIAENPLSFYKTFNPNHAKGDYGYNTEKSLTTNISPSTERKVFTPLPIMSDNETINYEILFNDLISKNISRYNYAPNIVENDELTAPGSSRMAYLNYQMLTETFLDALDKFGVKVSTMAGNTLKQQWTDLVVFEENIKAISSKELDTYTKDFLKITQSFYKKYIKGLPITFNPKFINKVKDKTINYDLLIEEKGFWASSMSTSKMFKQLKELTKDSWQDIVRVIQIKDTPENKSEDIVFTDKEGKEIDLYSATNEDIQSMDLDTRLKLAVQLSAWFNLFFEGRISMYLMQTAYSRAPYFVQEKLKNSLANVGKDSNSEFGISFNVVPFDPNLETKGTMLKTKINNKTSINVYGLDQNEKKLIDLRDSNGNDLNSKLFNNNTNNKPIIINESFAKSIDVKVGDVVNLSIERNTLTSNGSKVVTDIDQKLDDDITGYKENYITESNRTYQSKNGKNFADESLGGIKPVSINKKNISATGAMGSTGQTEINKAMSKGEIESSIDTKNENFVITGIQKSFGKPQAWTTNAITNNLMEYNKTQETIFQQWFKTFDLVSTPLQNFVFSDLDEKTDNDQVITKIQGMTYQELKDVSNSDDPMSKYYKKYLTIFENTYPIFNYKYSQDTRINDIESSMSTTTSNGDFSAIGLNGSFAYKKEDESCKDEDGKEPCELVPDPNKFIEGYAVGSTAMAVPMDQARLVLSQLTELVQMITIMFIVFAMVISSIIILLVTSIVISENSQFIATMKLLGYRKRYIIWQIISIYLVAILIAYIIGFSVGWFSFMGVTDYLAHQGSWILPVSFKIWMPFVVAGLLSMVFLATFYVAYEKIKKLTPVQALDA